MDILQEYCERLLLFEGGESTNPNDPAAKYPRPDALGPVHTNKGITWQTFIKMAEACGYSATPENFLAMPEAIWDAIFRKEFWEPCLCAQFTSPGLAALVADCAFNSGEGYGVKWLQEAINAYGGHVEEDDRIGPLTVAAANELDPSHLIENMTVFRLRDLALKWDWPQTQREWEGLQSRCNLMKQWALDRA